MTDFNNIFVSADIIELIGYNLTIPELTRFKRVCHLFNDIGSDVQFLQPLYQRLYLLDKTLPALLAQQSAVLEFKHAFEKVKNRQDQEIFFLKANHTQKYDDTLKSLLAIPGNTLEQLEKRDLLLTHVNSEIIQDAVEQQSGRRLNLAKCITRFILTKANLKYFRHLRHLDCNNNLLTTLDLQSCLGLQEVYCCDNSQLSILNLKGCTALTALSCNDNQLISLNLQGLASLQALHCPKNLLTHLNLQGCRSLQDVFCSYNQLTSLNLEGCTALKSLYCENNPRLNSLNLEGCMKLQQLHCRNNPLLTILNLQKLVSIKWLYCDTNKLITLNLEETSPIFQARYSSLVEEILELRVKNFAEKATLKDKIEKNKHFVNQPASFLPSFFQKNSEVGLMQRKAIKIKKERSTENAENKSPHPN